MAGSVGSYGRLDNLDFETNSDHFRAQGAILVDEGVDLLILVTLGSTARTIKAMVNATRDLGVPVWVSISCVRDRDTGAVMFGIEESSEATYVAETYGPLPEAVREIMTVGLPRDALGSGCDRGRCQGHACDLVGTCWCLFQRGLPSQPSRRSRSANVPKFAIPTHPIDQRSDPGLPLRRAGIGRITAAFDSSPRREVT